MDLSAGSFVKPPPCSSNNEAWPWCRSCHWCTDAFSVTKHIPHANSYTSQWADTGTRSWTLWGLFAWAGHPDHPLLLTSQLHHSALVQVFLCSPVMCSTGTDWDFAIQPCLGLPEALSSVPSLSLVWDQEASLISHRPETLKPCRQLNMYIDPIDSWKEYIWVENKWQNASEGLSPKIIECFYRHLQVRSCHGDFSLPLALGNDT